MPSRTVRSFDAKAIARQRLRNQGIGAAKFDSAEQVVAGLMAMQAQDYAGAKWAIGSRLIDATDNTIEQAISDGRIVRTWPMRGTLHFVAATDVRWMLRLLTPRIVAGAATRRKQLELDDAVFARCEKVFWKALAGGKVLTRGELMELLNASGISTAGQRGYHLLWWAAQKGLICFGPVQGKQHSFVWLDDWVPGGKKLSSEEALAILAERYFCGHGPATVRDFAWWSGLKISDARAGVEAARLKLSSEKRNEETYWMSRGAGVQPEPSSRVFLLSGFDEYILGYQDRSAVLDPLQATKIVPGNNGMFNPTLIIDGRVAGTWRRVIKKKVVEISVSPFAALSKAEIKALLPEAERFGRFLKLPEKVLFV